MAVLWIVLAVLGVTAAIVVLRVLAGVLKAARQLQRNVQTLGESVNAELQRLNGDADQPGAPIDEGRPR